MTLPTLSILLLALALEESGKDFFSRDQIIPIGITIPEGGIRTLEQKPRENVTVEVTWPGQPNTKATLHLKGHGSFRPIREKPSFTIHLSDQKFYGHKRILLNNSAQDSSMMRWKLASELFLKAGVPAARVNFATLTLNKRNLGTYLLVEPTDKVFLKHHFNSAGGNLYEGSNNDVSDRLDVDNGDPNGDQADLESLAAACQEPNLNERWRKLNQILDVDRFLSFMAVEVLVCHHDGYSMDRNNFRIYHDPVKDRMVFLPHGLDLIFDQPTLGLEPRFSGMVAQSLVEVPEGREAYLKRVNEMAHRLYGDDTLLARLDQIVRDLKIDGNWTNEIKGLRSAIKARIRFVSKQ
jgi:spore coat protein H